ncbi:MAG TPA: enoyl-CoA hydratase/isomerase family protein [Jatrophihabitantaceae bacterium]|nr:enoyl-CoA hydratase/isomerase family protein [Jatrophihabitantaceae bacterium]
MKDTAAKLVLSGDGPVRRLTISNPGQANAITLDMHRELAYIWRELAIDPTVHGIVLAGEGAVFSAGGDMDMLRTITADGDIRRRVFAEAELILEEMLRFPKPVVAAVRGFAVGLGVSLAVACDVVLLAEDAYLSDPHVRIGVVAGDGGAALWPSLTPTLRTREWLYCGDKIPAAVAVEVGLASRTVADELLLEEAERVATRMTALPRHAFELTKRAVNMPLLQTSRQVMPFAIAAEQLTFHDDEIRETVERFDRKATTREH